MSEHAQRFHGDKTDLHLRPGLTVDELIDFECLLERTNLTKARFSRKVIKKATKVLEAEGLDGFEEWIE